MKKTLALILALMMVLFAGCTSEKASDEKEESREKNKESVQELIDSFEEKEKENESDEEKDEEQPERVLISDKWLELMGKTSDAIADIKGKMTENQWADGPLYRFGPENVWYAFENYDFAEDNSYIPLGSCNSIRVPLNMLLENEEISNAETLENTVGKILTEGYDAMYECNTYSVTYRGYRFVIYESDKSNISGKSVVNIERE